MWKTKIDKNGNLDHRNQNKWQGNALLHQGDDQKNGNNGDGIDNLKVVIRGLNHILHTGGFADEHPGGVVPL